MTKTSDHPRVIAPPPLLYFTGLFIGYALDWIWPWRPFAQAMGLGIVLIGVGLAIALWAVITFRRAKTPVNPARTPTQLVRQGPFRRSRNPIYLSMTVVSLGLAILLNDGWMMLWLIPVMITLHYGVILREEQFLEARFGSLYEDYQKTVPRWL